RGRSAGTRPGRGPPASGAVPARRFRWLRRRRGSRDPGLPARWPTPADRARRRQGRPQRSVPVWQWQEVQALPWAAGLDRIHAFSLLPHAGAGAMHAGFLLPAAGIGAHTALSLLPHAGPRPPLGGRCPKSLPPRRRGADEGLWGKSALTPPLSRERERGQCMQASFTAFGADEGAPVQLTTAP